MSRPKKKSLFLEDVMGSFYSPRATGLVDSKTDKEFDEVLLNVVPVVCKVSCCRSVIEPVRERAGLGKPPSHFTTNANESINNVVKQALQYEERNWDKFCDEMFNLVKIQYQELEKAIVRTGEYRFQAKFAYLEK